MFKITNAEIHGNEVAIDLEYGDEVSRKAPAKRPTGQGDERCQKKKHLNTGIW